MNIQVIRESGGIGDVIKCGVVIRETQRQYQDSTVYVYSPPQYQDLYVCSCPAIKYVPISFKGCGRRDRRKQPDPNKWPYLKAPEGVVFDKVINLYDPAFHYEVQKGKETDKDRIDLWCEAAGVTPYSCTPHLIIPPRAMDKAYTILKDSGISFEKPLVGVQPFSTDPARDWPSQKFRDLLLLLEKKDVDTIILDGVLGRAKLFPGIPIAGLDYLTLAAVIKFINVLVGPDSGPNHIAAAVGTRGIGLFASQNGFVTYKHYPKHVVIQQQGKCAPCYWQRPKTCLRSELKREHRTCAVLEELPVRTVLRTVLDNLVF